MNEEDLIRSVAIFGVILFVFTLFGGWNSIHQEYSLPCSAKGCEDKANGCSSYCLYHEMVNEQQRAKDKILREIERDKKKAQEMEAWKQRAQLQNSEPITSSGKSSSISGWSSYDAGYEAIADDEDFDWDRYETDWEYALGVDDAMDEFDW